VAGAPLVDTLEALAAAVALGLPALRPTLMLNERCAPCRSTVMLVPGSRMMVSPLGRIRVMSCAHAPDTLARITPRVTNVFMFPHLVSSRPDAIPRMPSQKSL